MRAWTVPASLLALLALAMPALARFGLADARTEEGQIISDVYAQIFIVALIVFVFVMALMAVVLVRYREKGGKGRATYEKERDNLKAEMAWTIIPLIIVMWVGVISYQALVDIDGIGGHDVEPEIVVGITGSQYAWTAQYDTGVKVLAAANEDVMAIDAFYIPADTPIAFEITSTDVIHSLWIVGENKVDAVPGQINSMFFSKGFPEGEYFTQCAEDCKTPGHSYMHARIVSVPEAEYDAWTEETLAGAAAGVQQMVPVLHDGTVLTAVGHDRLARGATALIQIANNGTSEETFRIGDQNITIRAGGFDTIEFPVQETGALSLTTDSGASLSLTAVEPVAVDVGLGDYVIEPASMSLDAGELYVFNVENVHNTVHNLYIGIDGDDGNTDGIWWTNNLAPGDKQSILVIPSEPASLETWCAVPGHYSLGMYGTLTIA